MATHILTPKESHPLTGLANPLLGWEFSGATAMDVFEGCNIIANAGWNWSITPDKGKPGLWRMLLIGPMSITITDTEWFVFDGYFVRVLTRDDVTTNYTVTTKAG